MKRTLLITCALLLSILGCGNEGSVPLEPTARAESNPESVIDRASYGIGYNLGRSLAEQGVEANLELLLQAVRTGFSGQTPALTDDEMQTALTELQQSLQAQQQEQQQEQGTANRQAGAAFLAENAQRAEVSTTASGLQYEVLVEGMGPKPSATDTVKVHYHGTLTDGTVFDSSVDRGEPVEFPLNGVIAGWTEGLQLMGVGSKWKLFLPADLAYGDRGAGPQIGPGASLIFEVELLEIKK